MSAVYQLVFECPVCGMQMAAGTVDGPRIDMRPPTCHLMHAAVEMEQKSPEAWTPWGDE